MLQHDPVYLAEDLSHMNAVLRAGANVVRKGSTATDSSSSGWSAAAGATRCSPRAPRSRWRAASITCRCSRGWKRPARRAGLGDGGVVLRVLAGAEVGSLWEVSARGNTTFYLGPRSRSTTCASKVRAGWRRR